MNLAVPDQQDEPRRYDVERVEGKKAPKIRPGGGRRDKVQVIQEDKQGDQAQSERTQDGNLQYVMTIGLLGLLARGFVRI